MSGRDWFAVVYGIIGAVSLVLGFSQPGWLGQVCLFYGLVSLGAGLQSLCQEVRTMKKGG